VEPQRRQVQRVTIVKCDHGSLFLDLGDEAWEMYLGLPSTTVPSWMQLQVAMSARR
jgi:hypothetical protein